MERIRPIEAAGAARACIYGRGDTTTPASNWAALHQVHGNVLHRADTMAAAQERPQADGLLTNNPEVILTIRVADCVPLWLYHPRLRAGALLHAGREGTILNIARAGVHALADAYGAAASELHAHIGPSAGPCCYEVSEEMAGEFRSRGLPTNGRMLDLWGANELQLRNEGVLLAQITCSSQCTICSKGYYSYRGGDDKLRNVAMLQVS